MKKTIYVLLAISLVLLLLFPKTSVVQPSPSSLACEEIQTQEFMINLPNYKQGDSAWGDYPVGTQGANLRQVGCGMTAIAMVLANYGINVTPLDVTKRLESVGGVAPGGQLNWWSLVRAFKDQPTVNSQITFLERQATPLDKDTVHQTITMDVALKRIKRLIQLGNPVMLQVDAVGNKRGNHWVVAKTTDFLINDPLDGQTKLMSTSHYGTPEAGIYGYAAVIGTPLSYPDDGDPKVGSCVAKLALARRNINKDLNVSEAFDVLIR